MPWFLFGLLVIIIFFWKGLLVAFLICVIKNDLLITIFTIFYRNLKNGVFSLKGLINSLTVVFSLILSL